MPILSLPEKVGRFFTLLFLSSFLILISSSSSPLAAQDTKLTEEQKIIHVLNRLGFGPRLGDIEKVKAMGVQAYIERQLHPENIPDPIVKERLANLPTLRMALEERLEADSPVGLARRRSMISKLEAGTDKTESDLAAAGNPSRPSTMNPTAMISRKDQPQDLRVEIRAAKLIRAVYSERQLQEVMVDFWFNHFNVFARAQVEDYLSDYEQNVIRPRTLGKFEDLLIATAQHPAMLSYLDNALSSAPEEVVREKLNRRTEEASLTGRERREWHLRMPRMLETYKGLNENYGREVMELHTVGVDGGYTQEDVIEVSKSFTGWTIRPLPSREEGTFVFDPDLHVEGDKVVMGHTIQSGGIEEGLQVLKILAQHPSTARFISTKLVRRFVADDPPAELVTAASRTFERSNGDIREVLRTIFTSSLFFSAETYQAKVKKPLELVASSLRSVNADLPLLPKGRKLSDRDLAGYTVLRQALSQMGEDIYRAEPPTGYPDQASAWINTNALVKRLNFAFTLTAGLDVPYRPGGAQRSIPFQSNIKADLQSAQLLLERLGISRPNRELIEQGRALAQSAAQDQPGPESSMMGMSMMGGGVSAQVFDPKKVSTQAIAIALMLGSPQFQKR
ncbi:MAG: DUF1800 domain-containing protein [Acidobacteria bacterium]|nr:DUF1800 domain-containing protein [Acidobacteriota bacterium]